MRTMMATHINNFGSSGGSTEGGFRHGFWFAHKGDDGAVSSFSWVYVQQLHAPNAFYSIGNLADDAGISALAEIGNTLYQTTHGL